jgi:hypothetical protein
MAKGRKTGVLWSDVHVAAKLAITSFIVWMLYVCALSANVLPKSFAAASALCVALQVLPIAFSIWFFISKWRNRLYKGSMLATISALIPLGFLATSFVAGSSLNRIVYEPHAVEVRCQANLKKVYAGLTAYAHNHGGLLPEGQDWCDVLIDGGYLDANNLVCPAVTTPCRSTYILNSSIAQRKLDDLAGNAVLVYEDACGWNQTSTSIEIHAVHHVVAGRRLVDVLFADGSIRGCTESEIADMNNGSSGQKLTH